MTRRETTKETIYIIYISLQSGKPQLDAITPRIPSKNTTLANNRRSSYGPIQQIKVMSYVIRQ